MDIIAVLLLLLLFIRTLACGEEKTLETRRYYDTR